MCCRMRGRLNGKGLWLYASISMEDTREYFPVGYSLNVIPGTPKQAFLSFGCAVPRFTLSFASQKRTKAFYSAKQNTPFALNLA
jgi:hypothetical protein